MPEWNEQQVFQEVRDRLTKLEERGISRDERAERTEKRSERIEASLERLTNEVEKLAGDIRDAKTGLRVGFAIVGGFGTVAGWVASDFWPFK